MDSVKANARIRVQSTGPGYPPGESGSNSVPARAAPLTATPKDAAPQRAEPIAKSTQRSQVFGYSMIAIVAFHDAFQPRPYFADRLMHSLT